EERAGELGAAPVVADGLSDRQNVRLREGAIEWTAAMSAGAKADQLTGILRVRSPLIIVAFELVNVDPQRCWSGLARGWMRDHRSDAVGFCWFISRGQRMSLRQSVAQGTAGTASGDVRCTIYDLRAPGGVIVASARFTRSEPSPTKALVNCKSSIVNRRA